MAPVLHQRCRSQPSQTTALDLQEHTCDICQVKCSSLQQLKEHKGGRAHAKQLARWLDTSGRMYEDCNGVVLSTPVNPEQIETGAPRQFGFAKSPPCTDRMPCYGSRPKPL